MSGKRREWSEDELKRLREYAKQGFSLSRAGAEFGVTKSAVSGAATRNSIIFAKGTEKKAAPEGAEGDGEDDQGGRPGTAKGGALPAGHPVTWGAITAGTSLDGVPYMGSRGAWSR